MADLAQELTYSRLELVRIPYILQYLSFRNLHRVLPTFRLNKRPGKSKRINSVMVSFKFCSDVSEHPGDDLVARQQILRHNPSKLDSRSVSRALRHQKMHFRSEINPLKELAAPCSGSSGG